MDESDDGKSMRMCYGGVLLARKIKEQMSLPRGSKDEVQYNLSQLNSSQHDRSSTYRTPFSAPSGLSTPQNESTDHWSGTREFLPRLKPLYLHSETLKSVELAIQAVHNKVISHLTNVLATAGGGCAGGGGGGGGAAGGGSHGGGGGWWGWAWE